MKIFILVSDFSLLIPIIFEPLYCCVVIERSCATQQGWKTKDGRWGSLHIHYILGRSFPGEVTADPDVVHHDARFRRSFVARESLKVELARVHKEPFCSPDHSDRRLFIGIGEVLLEWCVVVVEVRW